MRLKSGDLENEEEWSRSDNKNQRLAPGPCKVGRKHSMLERAQREPGFGSSKYVSMRRGLRRC